MKLLLKVSSKMIVDLEPFDSLRIQQSKEQTLLIGGRSGYDDAIIAFIKPGKPTEDFQLTHAEHAIQSILGAIVEGMWWYDLTPQSCDPPEDVNTMLASDEVVLPPQPAPAPAGPNADLAKPLVVHVQYALKHCTPLEVAKLKGHRIDDVMEAGNGLIALCCKPDVS